MVPKFTPLRRVARTAQRRTFPKIKGNYLKQLPIALPKTPESENLESKGRRRLPPGLEPVADPAQRLQIARMPRIALNLLAQAAHKNVN